MSDESTHGERETLLDYLTSYRAILVTKCEGLTPEQLATASVPPSNLSLLGPGPPPGRGRAELVPARDGA